MPQFLPCFAYCQSRRPLMQDVFLESIPPVPDQGAEHALGPGGLMDACIGDRVCSSSTGRALSRRAGWRSIASGLTWTANTLRLQSPDRCARALAIAAPHSSSCHCADTEHAQYGTLQHV